jgi:carbonic anhydrase
MMTPRELVSQTSASRSSFFNEHAPLFGRLVSEGQFPDIVFIGCDDSRMVPEAITGAKPGDLFVLRNVANIVPPYGTGERAVGATLEYAVRHLKVSHILLCGHTDCGGIKALDAYLDPLHEPHLSRWIEYARPAQTQVDARGVHPDARHRAIVERNVLLQLENLRTYDVVREALQARELTLHGWVYNLSTGRISYWDADEDRFVDEGEL